MDLLKTFLESNNTDLISSLVTNGFTQDQAEKFLPEAADSASSFINDDSSSLNIDDILSKIDISGLAAKVGISPSVAEAGLKQILPLIISKLGGSDLNKLMGSMKNLF